MNIINNTDINLINGIKEPIINITPKSSLLPFISDSNLSLIAPVLAYWLYSIYFHLIDIYQLLEKYRIHPSEEQLSKNKVTQFEVIRDVIFQHIIQSITGLIVSNFETHSQSGYENNLLWNIKQKYSLIPTEIIYLVYWYGISILKIFIAFIIIDTWQYYLHKLMHKNKFLYKHFHSRHHQLYVPYAFGALFNNPVEGFLLDTLGTGIASISLGLTERENIFLYTFSTLKTVDDHCGYSLPWDLFQLIFPNNSIYHDIHHQMFGIKYNFSQPFFIFWDKLNNTTYHGIDEYKAKQKEITIDKYRQFLKERKEKSKKDQ